MGNFIKPIPQQYAGDQSFYLLSQCAYNASAERKRGDDDDYEQEYEDEPCQTKQMAKIDEDARRQLVVASMLCGFFMVAETIGGLVAGSLAVMTDAAHMLTDFASFGISLFAMHMAVRPATKAMPFGWFRAEIIGALMSILMIWVVTAILVMLAIQRTMSGHFEIDAKVMLITSSIGVAVNIVMGIVLHQAGIGHSHHGLECPSHGHSHGGAAGHGHSHGGLEPITETGYQSTADNHGHSHDGHGHSHDGHGHSHDGHGHSHDGHGHSHDGESNVRRGMKSQKSIDLFAEVTQHEQPMKSQPNINVRAAFIHVLGDLIQSVGVLVAAIIIYFRHDWKYADPICTFIFSILVLITTLSVMKDAVAVLMEGTPTDVNYNEIRRALLEVDGVRSVHNLRCWSLTLAKRACTVHVTASMYSFR